MFLVHFTFWCFIILIAPPILKHNVQNPNNIKCVKFIDGEPTIVDQPIFHMNSDFSFSADFKHFFNQVNNSSCNSMMVDPGSCNTGSSGIVMGEIVPPLDSKASNASNDNDVLLNGSGSTATGIVNDGAGTMTETIIRLSSLHVGGTIRRSSRLKSLSSDSQPYDTASNGNSYNMHLNQRKSFKQPFTTTVTRNTRRRKLPQVTSVKTVNFNLPLRGSSQNSNGVICNSSNVNAPKNLIDLEENMENVINSQPEKLEGVKKK